MYNIDNVMYLCVYYSRKCISGVEWDGCRGVGRPSVYRLNIEFASSTTFLWYKLPLKHMNNAFMQSSNMYNLFSYTFVYFDLYSSVSVCMCTWAFLRDFAKGFV